MKPLALDVARRRLERASKGQILKARLRLTDAVHAQLKAEIEEKKGKKS